MSIHFTVLKSALTYCTDDLIAPFEKGVNSLVSFLGNADILGEYSFAFKLRLDSLLFRCRLVSLEENCRMLAPLNRLGKQTLHAELLLHGVRTITIPRLLAGMAGTKDSILACQKHGLKRLEVELRLVQLASRISMESSGTPNALVGAEAEVKGIIKICMAYPDTAGLMLPSCRKVHLFIRHDRQAVGHPIYSKETHETWWSWPKHSTGDLRRCEKGHPYSGISMAHCPECGPQSEASKIPEVNPEASLKTHEFMIAIKAKPFDGSSYRSSKSSTRSAIGGIA